MLSVVSYAFKAYFRNPLLVSFSSKKHPFPIQIVNDLFELYPSIYKKSVKKILKIPCIKPMCHAHIFTSDRVR